MFKILYEATFLLRISVLVIYEKLQLCKYERIALIRICNK